MIVSVICPTHGNRDLTLLKQSIPDSKDIELIIVDEGLERSQQRNIGIKRAKGKYLLILDSDQSISEGLIDECVYMIEKLGYDCLYIPEIIIADSFFGKIRAFERCLLTGTAVDVPRFVRRKKCPWFNLTLNGPEDAEWGNRLPEKRAITTSVLFHHDDISFGDFCRKKAYYSKSMKKYAELWPEDLVLNFKYRCWTIYTERGKYKHLLRHPIMTLGIIFILIVRGIIYYKNR